MKEEYAGKIKAGIGNVGLSAVVSDSFPLVGDTVRLSSAMKWAQSINFKTESTAGVVTEENRTGISQQETKDLLIGSEGDLKQVLTAGNPISSKEVVKYIYANAPRTEPYYDLSATKEIIRTDGETTRIKLTAENGYDFTRPSVVSVKIYRENDYTEPVKTLTNADFTVTSGEMISIEISIAKRGIYDVIADYTDSGSGLTISKQINKLVTVTPALAPRPTPEQVAANDYTTQNTIEYFDTGNVKKRFTDKIYETAPGKYYIEWIMPKGQDNTGWYPALDISGYPAGSTLVLKYDPAMNGEKYHMRLLLKGNKPCSESSQNGTPNFTYDLPLVITFDQQTPFTIWGVYYCAVNFDQNIRNTVFDGRGYHNLEKGIKIDRYSPDIYFEDSMMLLNGTSDVEIFEVELCNTGFTGIASKTDPDPNRPWYWRGNFVEDNFIWHHSHVHDTSGEGFYIGYFSPDLQKRVNSNGQAVEYQPHALEHVRIYRNHFENMGYDGMQLSNALHSEVCYNTIINGGAKNELNQASGISIQSMGGKIYNNLVTGYYGPGLQAGPLGDLEIFNNIINNGKGGGGAIQLLWGNDCPDQNPDGTGINNTTQIWIHNNVLMSNYICINARNTTQFRKMFIHDNFLTYRGAIVGSQTTETMDLWMQQMRGNITYKFDEITPEVLNTLKIADMTNNNFRISATSSMVGSGEGKYFRFDYRGYKSWYPNVFPTGAFMGQYRDPAIYVTPLQLKEVILNEGATETYLPVLTVRFNFTGHANRYRIGLQPDLSDAQWVDLSENMTYTLDAAYGLKTIYAQVAGAIEESEIVSKTIGYIYKPTVLTGITINNGEASTIFDKVEVKMNYLIGRPEQYAISESEDFTGIGWADFSDTVDYMLSGASREVTLYVKVRKDGIESDVRSATISYTSTIGYKNIVLRIPLSEVGGGTDQLQVAFPELKYGKRMAFSWTTDDTLIYVYSRMFNYINKKWVDDSKIMHDGMPHTTGIMPSRYLCYTDGCGKEIRFGLNSGFISHLNGKTPTLDYDYSGSQYFHLKEMQKFIDFGNGLQNHGAGGYNDEGAQAAIRICNEEVHAKLGFTPFLLLFPGEEDQATYKAAGLADPDIYQMTGAKATSIGLKGLSDSFFRDKESFMHRYTYDTFTLSQLKEKADYAYNADNAHLMNLGGHNILIDDTKFIDWNATVKPFLDYLYDTYGKGGNDTLWFAPLEEIYEYLFMRHFSTITLGKDDTDLIINLKLARMKGFRQKDISLKLSGIDLSEVVTINSADTVLYNLDKNVQPDQSLLVNLSYDENLNLLAEKYVSSFETLPSQDRMEDARYMVSRLRDDLAVPYLARIAALDVPFGLKSVSINKGATETIKPSVDVAIEYNGFITPAYYKLSESANLEDATWIDFVSEASFTLSSSLGSKTIYCQLKAQDGTISEIRSATINYVDLGEKTIKLSLGWSNAEIKAFGGTSQQWYFDESSGINKQYWWPTNNPLYWTYGDAAGVFGRSDTGGGVAMSAIYKGAITGNNSFTYPDEIMEHNIYCGGNKAGIYSYREAKITLPPGVYAIKLFCSTIFKTISRPYLKYQLVTAGYGTENEVTKDFVLPDSFDVINNTSEWLEETMTVGAEGVVYLRFGLYSETSYSYTIAPLNILEIKEV